MRALLFDAILLVTLMLGMKLLYTWYPEVEKKINTITEGVRK